MRSASWIPNVPRPAATVPRPGMLYPLTRPSTLESRLETATACLRKALISAQAPPPSPATLKTLAPADISTGRPRPQDRQKVPNGGHDLLIRRMQLFCSRIALMLLLNANEQKFGRHRSCWLVGPVDDRLKERHSQMQALGSRNAIL